MPPPPPVDPAVITNGGGSYVRTADNRIVEYSVHGNPSADTVVVSAYIAEYLCGTVFEYGDNIKVITVSIPGLGNSEYHPGHSISKWPKTDLQPVLDKEAVTDFIVWGNSLGTLYAMAIAQHFGSTRVQSLGLRVPCLPQPVSKQVGLVDGQPTFPTTREIQQNTLTVKLYRFFLQSLPWIINPGPFLLFLMRVGLFGSNLRSMARFYQDYSSLATYLKSLMKYFGPEAMLYAMAKDVALDCPGLDPRLIQIPNNKVVVWYATDDSDCPPSHGKWLIDECFASAADAAGCRYRKMSGYGHVGGAFLEMDAFVEELLECSQL